MLISSAEVLPSCCALLNSLVASQACPLPQLAQNTAHTVATVDITTCASRLHSLALNPLCPCNLSNIIGCDLLLLAHCESLSIIFTYWGLLSVAFWFYRFYWCQQLLLTGVWLDCEWNVTSVTGCGWNVTGVCMECDECDWVWLECEWNVNGVWLECDWSVTNVIGVWLECDECHWNMTGVGLQCDWGVTVRCVIGVWLECDWSVTGVWHPKI